jgi:hypothetical protein
VTSASAAACLRSARELLSHLISRLGRAGLTAASTRPGLLAALDQHIAAVRDALGDGWRIPSVTALAGYAAGLRDRAAEHRWEVPAADEVEWTFAPWPVLRIVAVCALADQAGAA